MKKRKLLSLLMATVMVLTLIPATVFAEEGTITTAESLQAAIDAAPNSKETQIKVDQGFEVSTTITVEENKNIVLDLNGQTITVSSDFGGRPFKIKGTLRVVGNGTVDTSASVNGYGSFDNYGRLYIENGSFTGSVDAGGAVVKNRPESYCEIYDGTFTGTPTAVYNEGITKIYNGTFEGYSCSVCNRESWGYTIQSHWNGVSVKPELYFYNGIVIGVQGAFSTSAGYSEIRDGTFKTVACEEHPDGSSAWYALYVAGESGVVECHVYGGVFESLTRYAAYIGNSNDGGNKLQAAATIHGGTFISGRNDYVIFEDVTLGRVNILGGSFYLNDRSVADVSKWVADGYEQNENGTVEHAHAASAIHTAAKQPTCTEVGNVEYWYCKTCDLYFGDKACTEQISEDKISVPANGHSYENGICTVCGAADPDYVPPTPVYIYYDITASAGEGGTITPDGNNRVLRGTDKTFTITPDRDYVVSDVLVDGKSVGAVTSYTFETVREDHSIQVLFELSEEAQEAIRNEKLKKGVESTTIRLRSTLGNGFIRLDWEKSAGYKVDYYEVYKSTKRDSGYGTEPYFETKQGGLTGWYKNTKELKKGTRYYYKVRGVREIAGKTVYTKWSTKAWRMVK